MKPEIISTNINFKTSTLSKKKNNDYFWAYLMIFPIVAGLTIFYIIPFFQSVYYSFTNMGAFGEYSWTGLDNYKRLLTDKNFYLSLRNTLIYTVIQVPISVCLSILVAVFLNAKISGLSIYRTLYFLPAVTMPAAVAMVWKWLYNTDYGLINFVLSKFSIKGPSWISNPNLALYSIIVVAVWMTVGYNMVILLAGLQGISSTYYEAAEIDGAGSIAKFFNITLPSLSPTIFFVLIMAMISAFQAFDVIFMMVSKSSIALEKTQTVVYLFYNNAFDFNEKGYASAIAIILFIIIMFITFIQMKLQKKWVNYN